MTIVDVTEQQIKNLLEKAGLSSNIQLYKNCIHGGNNRTYRVETEDGVYALKKYFRGSADKRDRLASEFTFLKYANESAPKFVPRAYSQDNENGLALYEFIEGRPVQSGEVTEDLSRQAIEFFCLLNSKEKKKYAAHLPLASEASFSIQGHIDSVESRIQELEQEILKNTNQESKELINNLRARWSLLVSQIKMSVDTNDMNLIDKLDDSQKCVSPSDFGFHNALLTSDNQVKFIDFEYAGWDDPARMVGDFFSQLAVPIPNQYFDWFLNEAISPFSDKNMLLKRALILRPIYQIKWCCIALNVLIPKHIERRRFANPNLDVKALLKTQLAKANLILKNLET